MKLNWTIIRNIMKADLLAMRGGKKNGYVIPLVLFMVFILAAGFFISPIASLYLPFILGGFFVPAMFQNEMKYHSEKLWSILPIRRRDLLNARFLLAYGLFLGTSLLIYLLMLLSVRLELWLLLMDESDGGMTDILTMTANNLGMTKMGFFNLIYFGACTAGIVFMGNSLRNYFKDPTAMSAELSLSGKNKKAMKKEIRLGAVILGLLLLGVLSVTGIIPLIPMLMPLVIVLQQLTQAADGLILGIFLLTIGVLRTVVEYIRADIDYDNREL